MENSSSTTTWKQECFQLENREFELAEELKHDTNKDLERDANILKHIGVTYKKRGELFKDASHFVKASALFNSALIRAENSRTKSDLLSLRSENETSFLDSVAGVKNGNLSVNAIEKQKRELTSFRIDILDKLTKFGDEWNVTYDINAENDKRVEEEKKIIDQVCKISTEISEFMKTLVRNILHECFSIIGTPPQKYAVLGLGSLARNEMTPYSDLESAILIEDDTRDKQYFRNLANLFHLFVLNFGETLLPALAITCLNNFDQVGGDWFFDSVTSNGFCMDGAMPWACKTPIGRPDREHKQGIELIQTADKMSSFQLKEIAQKEGYHLADILCTCTLIEGSEDLFEKYQTLLNSDEHVKNRKQRAEQTLAEDLEKYQEKMTFMNRDNSSTRMDVKQEIFRFPSLIANGFRMMHNLNNKTPWLVLREMEEKRLISFDGAHNIVMAVSVAILFRLMTYMSNNGQINSLSFLSNFEILNPAQDIGNTNVIFSSDNIQWIMRYYFTVKPLLGYLSSESVNKRELSKQTFYEHNHKTKADIYRKFAQYNKAIAYYKEYLLEIDCSSQTYTDMRMPRCNQLDTANVLRSIAKSYNGIGDYNNALSHSKQCLQILERHPTDIIAIHYKAEIYNIIGLTYYYKGEYDNALLYLRKSLNLGMPNFVAVIGNIGLVHYQRGEYDEALSCHNQILDVMRKEYDWQTTYPVLFARTISNIAMTYESKKDYDMALSYFQQSLEKLRNIHGNTAFPDTAKLLSNIGVTYRYKKEYDMALFYQNQALEMSKKLYGDTAYPETALTLNVIGKIYSDKEDFTNALEYHHQSLDMYQKLFGESPHPDFSTSLNNTGATYYSIDQYDKALFYCHQALNMNKNIHGDAPHPDIIIILGNLVGVYFAMGDYGNALMWLKRFSEMKQQLPGDTAHLDEMGEADAKMYVTFLHHKQYLKMKEKLHDERSHADIAESFIYHSKREYRLILLWHRTCLEMNKGINAKTANAKVARSLNAIGTIYSDMKQYGKALFYHKQSLKTSKNLHGNVPHRDIDAALFRIALVYLAKSEYCIALIWLHRSLQVNEQLHGDAAHSDIAAVLCTIGSVYAKIKMYDRALAYYNQSLRMKKEILGDGPHQEIAELLVYIALVYQTKYDYSKAVMWFQQSLTINKVIHCDTASPNIARVLGAIGSCYNKMKKYDIALSYHQKSLAMWKKIYGETAQSVIGVTLNNIGWAYQHLGNYTEASVNCHQSLEMHKKIHGDAAHLDIAAVSNNIGCLWQKKGDNDNALLYFQESLEIRKKLHADKTHPEIATSLNNVGTVYFQKKMYGHAAFYLRKAFPLYSNMNNGSGHPWETGVLRNLALVHQMKNSKADALLYFQQFLVQHKKWHGDAPDPLVPDTLARIGNVHHALREYDLALVSHMKAIYLDAMLFQKKMNQAMQLFIAQHKMQ